MSNIQEEDISLYPEPVTLSEQAVDKIIETAEAEGLENWFLRVGLIGGGCSGFSYNIDFETETKDYDFVFEQRGSRKSIKVCVDQTSAALLEGTIIEYSDGLQSGFKFINPAAKRTCGCNKSFSF